MTDPSVDAIAEQVLQQSDNAGAAKYVVGIAGPPGSGKTTLAGALVKAINERRGTGYAASLPMDGFHLTRAELRAMPDPEEAFRRRGAEWTFDPAGLADCLARIVHVGHGTAPSFDHGVGDPVVDGVTVSQHSRVVIVEGLYLLFRGTPEWCRVNDCFSHTIYLACDLDVALERLRRRHMQAWGISWEAADQRVRGNDRLNAELVIATRTNAKQIVQSVSWA
eukprot:TRINITY_DN43495_c0_g1_i1.p1 TRINITY_DN43495_c0_g1~~TRINITY_DN43495_c0_g1_i1.p1  ORF type:complete len:230 (+),score=20.13 TRINITY_DN43495_c0_g1_i1:27-692(+)